MINIYQYINERLKINKDIKNTNKQELLSFLKESFFNNKQTKYGDEIFGYLEEYVNDKLDNCNFKLYIEQWNKIDKDSPFYKYYDKQNKPDFINFITWDDLPQRIKDIKEEDEEPIHDKFSRGHSIDNVTIWRSLIYKNYLWIYLKDPFSGEKTSIFIIDDE